MYEFYRDSRQEYPTAQAAIRGKKPKAGCTRAPLRYTYAVGLL